MSRFLLIILLFLILLSCTLPNKSMRERYVRDTPELSADIKKAILDGDVIIGMSKEQVYASWATPIFKGEAQENDGTYEYWTYPNVKESPFVNIYFLDEIVVKIEKTDKEPAIK